MRLYSHYPNSLRQYANGLYSMLRDVEFFKTKLQHIDGFGSTGDYLADIIKSKQIKSVVPPPSEKKSEDQGEDFFDAEKEAQIADAEENEERKESVESDSK